MEDKKPDVIQKLYDKLDFLDEEIKRYEKAKQDCEKLIAVFEEDYQKVIVAIQVIANLDKAKQVEAV